MARRGRTDENQRRLDENRERLGVPERIPGGCPCGAWSGVLCAYSQATQLCRAPKAERPGHG
jgi:hypothetical protein